MIFKFFDLVNLLVWRAGDLMIVIFTFRYLRRVPKKLFLLDISFWFRCSLCRCSENFGVHDCSFAREWFIILSYLIPIKRAKILCFAQITNFNVQLIIQKDVMRLEVPVADTLRMHKLHCEHQLLRYVFNCSLFKWPVFYYVIIEVTVVNIVNEEIEVLLILKTANNLDKKRTLGQNLEDVALPKYGILLAVAQYLLLV